MRDQIWTTNDIFTPDGKLASVAYRRYQGGKLGELLIFYGELGLTLLIQGKDGSIAAIEADVLGPIVRNMYAHRSGDDPS